MMTYRSDKHIPVATRVTHLFGKGESSPPTVFIVRVIDGHAWYCPAVFLTPQELVWGSWGEAKGER